MDERGAGPTQSGGGDEPPAAIAPDSLGSPRPEVETGASRADAPIERRVIFGLATLAATNPVVVFLFTDSALLCLGVPIVATVVGQALIAQKAATIVKAYFFNALALLSILVHAEVALTYGLPELVIENLYSVEGGYYFNRPLLHQHFDSPEFSVTYRTSAQGYRIGTGQEPSHVVHRADWLFLGDSFTQGAQVEYEELYTTRLNLHFPDKVVVNAGISGMGIADEYALFRSRGAALKPALVVLQVGNFNDLMNVEPQTIGIAERAMARFAVVRLLLTGLRYRDPASLPLGRWTEPFYPDSASNARYNVFYKESSAGKERDLQQFAYYLRLLKEAVEDSGGRLMVLHLPTREQVGTAALQEVMDAFKLSADMIDLERPSMFLRTLATTLGVDYLDLLPSFRESSERMFFEQDEHLTPAGHAVMAAATAEYLERIVGSPQVAMLSRELAGDRYPSPSSDGTQVAYQSIRDGGAELFVADAAFKERRRLTFNRVDESHPVVSRDGVRILFTSGSAESQETDVVIMNVDGTGRRTLTSEPDTFGAIPTFSPSNLQVAYAEWTRETAGQLSNPQIVVLDLLTGTKRYLTPPGSEAWRPVFSPKEDEVSYIRKLGEQFEIFSFNLKSGVERQLTDTPFDEWDPRYSPDGSALYYAARPDDNWDLFMLDLVTGSTRRLTRSIGDEWDPAPSADGRELWFAGRFGSLEAIFRMPVGAER